MAVFSEVAATIIGGTMILSGVLLIVVSFLVQNRRNTVLGDDDIAEVVPMLVGAAGFCMGLLLFLLGSIGLISGVHMVLN